MKKIIAWLLVVALTAAISVGATLAYLTDTDEDVNVMTLGKVKIDQLEYERVDDETANEKAEVQEFHDNKPLYPAVTGNGFDYTPGDTYVDWTQIGKDGYTSEIWNPENINNELDKMVFIKNKGDYDAFVRSVFAFEAGNYTTLDQFKSMMHLNLNEDDFTWEWVKTPVAIPNAEGGTTNYFVATATYNKILAPGALTEISLSQIALDKTATNADVEAFGETYQILVKSQGIQADGFNNAIMALNDGFDVIDASNIPWEIDAPVVGTDVRTALKYLNADPTGTDITAKVTKVVFGLNSDHPEIVNGYEGILTSVEQDVPVHTYYVPNGSNYDVYLLANSDIYLPKDSSRLFQDMSSLVTVDTSNLNTSRTEQMNNLFYKCTALKNLDVSGFDTAKATTFRQMFYQCSSLKNLDVSAWDTGNVTDMYYMFYSCTGMTELDLRGLDMQNVETTKGMFCGAKNIQKVDATGWDLTGLLESSGMFVNCTGLKEIVGSGGWSMPNVVAVDSMIQSCDSLKTIDVTNWDLSSAKNLYSMFWNCDILESIQGCENWKLGSVDSMKSMFEKCVSLKDVNVGTWNIGSATDLAFMFFNCRSLAELNVSNWDVSNVVYFNSMFSVDGANTGAMSLKALDLSKWNPESALVMNNMFHGCSKITELDLSGWNMPNLTTTSHMFSDCYGLQSVDFTGWNTPSLTSMDAMFNDCHAIQVLDVSDFDTATCVEFSQLFEYCKNLKEVKGLEKWDTSKVCDFKEMFFDCKSLEVVDLSGFKTSSAKEVYRMFRDCTALRTIYVGDGWDMSKVTYSSEMFTGSNSLAGGNGSTLAQLGATDVTYARVDTAETPGYLTYKAPATTNP
jgi:predicted ribosomally synthesized peptide with SipW-like signal peptide